MTRPAPPGRARSTAPWWLNPAVVVLLVVPITLLISLELTDAQFREQFREPKYLTAQTAQLALVAALVMAAVATLVIAPGRRTSTSQVEEPALWRPFRRSASVLFWLTVLGYAAFGVSGALNGVSVAQVVGAFTSQTNYGGDFKEQFATVPGLTTLTQVGIAFEIVALYTLRLQREGRLVWQIVVVYLLATLRAFLLTERLALIELAAPLVAVLATGAVRHGRAPARRVVRLLPVFFVPVLLVVFAAFEYSRSWQFFKTRTELDFWPFMLLRMGGYYATAYNNGQLHLDHSTWPGRLPYDSVAAFWTAPGISSLGLYERWSAPAPAYAQDVLERYANPEFNNPGGLTTPFVDFGTVGGLVFFAVAGLVVGLLYRGMREGDITGSLLYPVAMTGLTDLPRLLYWSQGRVVPAVVALVAVSVVLHRARRPPWRTAALRRRRAVQVPPQAGRTPVRAG